MGREGITERRMLACGDESSEDSLGLTGVADTEPRIQEDSTPHP